jgi:hypothetical protein
MNKIIDSFSTRETALVIWIFIVFIASIFSKNFRGFIFDIFKLLLSWKISLSLIAFFVHTGFYIFILYRLGFWDNSLLKDTAFWIIGFGIVAIMNINKVNSNTYFKTIFLDAIKWTIAIEFIVNFFTFSLTKELIILPIIVFSATIQAVASFDKKHKQMEFLMKNLLLYFSLFVFLYSFYKTLTNHKDLFTFDNLKSFILPVILSITFLPFMYLFNLIAKYEDLWVILNCNVKNNIDRNRIKRHILWIAKFNIDKVVSISHNIAKPINIYNDLSYEMIKKVSKGKYVGYDE